jgi:hypothetical protein
MCGFGVMGVCVWGGGVWDGCDVLIRYEDLCLWVTGKANTVFVCVLLNVFSYVYC